MNSDERRAARRERRDAQREEKRRKRTEGCTLEAVADLDNICRQANTAANGVRWKADVQRFLLDTLGNAAELRDDILNGRDVHRGFYRFDICERGKTRHIAAVRFAERVVQKSLNQTALMPAAKPTLIADNSANIKGRGTEYAVKRMKKQLAAHYRRHGRGGYILLGDFSDYFGSIPHDGAKALVRRLIGDDAAYALACQQIDHQDGERGLALGSEINQTIAVTYPNRIDHFAIEAMRVEAYGRYMDDFYAIDPSKERLQVLLGCIEVMAAEIGLTLNAKKTHIVKLTHGFTFLKRKFSYTDSGRIVVRPARQTVTRMRRRMKRQARLVAQGRMTYRAAAQSFMSARGQLTKMDAHRTVKEADALFCELFWPLAEGEPWPKGLTCKPSGQEKGEPHGRNGHGDLAPNRGGEHPPADA